MNGLDLGNLVVNHQASLFAFLYRMSGDAAVAEDLMQETFVRALRASATYKPQGKLSAWLFSIAANLFKDYCRRKGARVFEPVETIADQLADPHRPTPEDQVLSDIEIHRVRQALLRLPLEQRAPLVLFFYHDMTYADIAKSLVIPVGTVRSRIHSGKARMRTLLEEGGAHE